MPTTTLRAYLTSPNASLTVHPEANCSSVRNDDAALTWSVVQQWDEWEEFSMENIDNLLGNLLDTTFEVANPPPPLKTPRLLRHESQFDFILGRQNNVIVNEALRVACRHLGLARMEWTRGGNDSGDRTFPDWSGTMVSESDDEENLIPGDTKFTRDLLRPVRPARNHPRDSDQVPISSPANRETNLARSCLQQVNHYAAARKARYFYVVTNKELFLCRRTMDPPLDSPIATRRTGRLGVSRIDLTPTPLQASPASSPPSIRFQSQRPAVSLGQVAADRSSSPVSRKFCVSKYHY